MASTKRKYAQLVFYDNVQWQLYAVHEALLDLNTAETYWIGSKALRKFDNYHDAVAYWSKTEKLSGEIDIVDYSDIKHLMDKVDYSEEEEELDFDN